MSRPITKSSAASESAIRTFIQAALPVFVLSIQGGSPGVQPRDLVETAVATAIAAGIAGVMRVTKPIQTDSPGVSVERVTSEGRNL